MEENQNNFNEPQSSFTQIPTQPAPAPQQTPARKTKWWVFVVGFLVIIALGIIVNALWYDYLSPAARDAARMKKQYAEYEVWQKSYDDAMKADTYGGKTPEETLALFIDALEKEDIDLASRYFMIDKSLGKQKWVDFLTKIKSEGNMKRFAEDLKTIPHEIHTDESTGGIVYLNSDGMVDLQISIKKIISEIWKIESL